jgi:flagellar protein FliS
MSNKYAANQYKQTSVQTANKGQVLIMLYEAAIKHVKLAQEGLEKKDMAAKGKAIGKAHDIVNELCATLNFEVGGQIALDLERLYNFIIEQLIKANVENNAACLQNVQKILENLLEGWRGAVSNVFNKGGGQK